MPYKFAILISEALRMGLKTNGGMMGRMLETYDTSFSTTHDEM